MSERLITEPPPLEEWTLEVREAVLDELIEQAVSLLRDISEHARGGFTAEELYASSGEVEKRPWIMQVHEYAGDALTCMQWARGFPLGRPRAKAIAAERGRCEDA